MVKKDAGGRPRVKVAGTKLISMRMDAALHAEVQALAAEERRTTSAEIEQLISEALAARKAKR